MEIIGYDRWLEHDCTDCYHDDVLDDYEPNNGMASEENDFVDDEYNNYIGG
jgi:hypothetical protein